MAHPKIFLFRRSAVIGLIVAALCLLVAICVASLLQPAVRARYLFKQLETLQPGRSTSEDAQRLANKIGAKPTPFAPCTQSKCEWEAKVDNSRFPLWWKGLGVAFLVSFNVEHSVVVRKNTGFGIGTELFYPSQVGIQEQEHWGSWPMPEPLTAGWQSTDRSRYASFSIYMTPKASAEDRRRYTDFNFSCFWKYKGCKDARELLPIAAQTPQPPQPK